jgi:hypothetical protein
VKKQRLFQNIEWLNQVPSTHLVKAEPRNTESSDRAQSAVFLLAEFYISILQEAQLIHSPDFYIPHAMKLRNVRTKVEVLYLLYRAQSYWWGRAGTPRL